MMRARAWLGLLIGLSSCSTGSPGIAPEASSEALSSAAASAIATDMAARLSETMPPSSNPIVFADDDSLMAGALRGALQHAGFTLAEDGRAEGPALQRIAHDGRFVEGRYFLSLRSARGDIARCYQPSETGATPACPWTMTAAE